MTDTKTIDINADAGESYGPWRMGADEELFPALTSVNVACGVHAGDPVTMRRTVELAARHGVAVGAHPGFPDREGFGRRDLAMSPDELHDAVSYQLGALDAFLRPTGGRLHHVKPHGALHHRIVRDEAAADAVARAIRDFAADLPFVVLAGPGGELMRRAGDRHGLTLVPEAFPDRGYLTSGHLAPRSRADALVTDPEAAAARAVRMATGVEIETVDGGVARLGARTLCIHGDNPGAAAIARAVHDALEAAGLDVRAF